MLATCKSFSQDVTGLTEPFQVDSRACIGYADLYLSRNFEEVRHDPANVSIQLVREEGTDTALENTGCRPILQGEKTDMHPVGEARTKTRQTR